VVGFLVSEHSLKVIEPITRNNLTPSFDVGYRRTRQAQPHGEIGLRWI
jgi:hypothetical protein